MLLSTLTRNSLRHQRSLVRAFSNDLFIKTGGASSKFLISTEELSDRINEPNLTVLHATMNQPHRDWKEQHLMERIPGSV